MVERAEVLFSRINKKTVSFFVLIGIVAIAISTTVRFNITGSYSGIYLLRGQGGALFEFRDDLLLGQEVRYITGIDFESGKQFLWNVLNKNRVKEPYLYYEWNKIIGEGFIRNYLSGGKQILICFSRFEDEFRKEASGLFVGGGLPADIREDNRVKKSATGMAYYDGVRWYHVWCNVNEALFNSKLAPIYPHAWKYLGSKILHREEKNLF